MPSAHIHNPRARIQLRSRTLEVRGPVVDDHGNDTGDLLLREIPLRDLERMSITEGVSFTSAALAAMMRADIPINLFSYNGRFLGAFRPAGPPNGRSRLTHYQRNLDPGFCLEIARRLVDAKILNQVRVIQRLATNRGQPGATAREAAMLKAHRASVATVGHIDEVRGHEGAAAAAYFGAWARFLPAEFPFERRSTRPPLNPVNACISFGATLIYQEMAGFLQSHGLDAALGCLHATEDGRWSLALDLIEPFRPALVEALAVDLFSRRMLGAGCFEERNGGVYLNASGRKKFLLQYEKRMDREFMSEQLAHRTSLRQQLEEQALQFKRALTDVRQFEPFLMN